MDLRALEPEDLPALDELCARPEIAREVDDVPGERSLQTAPGLNAAIGAFERGTLVGAAGLCVLPRMRQRHAATAWLAAPAEKSAALLRTLRDLARDWWHLDRLELILPLDSSSVGIAERLGFSRELHKRADLLRDGQLFAAIQLAWIRPGVTSAPGRREFPRASKAPLPASFEIRPATAELADGFARVLADPGVLWGTLQTPFTPNAIWKKRLAGNDPARNRVFAALVDGQVVGTCGLHGATSPRRQHVWALGMSIRDAWQGRGIGKRLMQHLVAVADELKIARLELDVYTDNTRAIALYEQFGFVREGVKRLEAWRDGAYSDALVMARVR